MNKRVLTIEDLKGDEGDEVGPFRWSDVRALESGDGEGYYAYAVDPITGNEFCDAVNARGVISSLLEDSGETVIFTCGCQCADCAGYLHQYFYKTNEYVILFIEQGDLFSVLCFDREKYEDSALRMLKEMAEMNIGWGSYYYSHFKSLDEFIKKINEAETAIEARRRTSEGTC